MRTFIAFTLPDEVAQQIADWQQQNAPEGVHLEPITNLHMTLAFLGDTPEELVPHINEILSRLDVSQVQITGPVAYEEQAKLAFLTYNETGGSAVWEQLNAELYRLNGYKPQFTPWLPHTTVWRFAPDHKPNVNPPLPSISFSPIAVTLYQSVRNEGGGATYQKVTNILDPIEKTLDQDVFKGIMPRQSVQDFIKRLYYRALDKRLDVEGEKWADLYMTGSLTTYQYSVTSDCDVSVFPNYDLIWKELGLDPDTARKELISLSIEHIDGTFLPGSTHPLQFFVVPNGTEVSDLYKPGLRSAFDLHDGRWFQKPEKDRVHDIAVEYPDLFHRAQDMADKLTQMLDAGDDEAARTLWHQIHKKRQLDQRAGLGDFCEGNIVYKYLLNEGLFDRIRDELGEYIAKTATNVVMVGDVEEDDVYERTTREPFVYAPEYDTLYFGPYGAHHHELILSAFRLNHNTDEEMQTEEFSKREQVAMTIEDDPGNLGIIIPDAKKVMYWGEPHKQVVQKIAEMFPDMTQEVYDWDDDPLYVPKTSGWKLGMPPAAQAPEFLQQFKNTPTPEQTEDDYLNGVRGYDWSVNPQALSKLRAMEEWGAPPLAIMILNPSMDQEWKRVLGFHKARSGGRGSNIWLHPFQSIDDANETLWHEIQHAYQEAEGRANYENYNWHAPNDPSQYEEHPMEIDANDFAKVMAGEPLVVVSEIRNEPSWVPNELHLDRGDWNEGNELWELSPSQLAQELAAQVRMFRTDREQWMSTWMTMDEYDNYMYGKIKEARDLWDDRVSTKVIYDFDKDTITLGTQATQATMPDSKIIGEYDDGIVTLYGVDKQWVSPQYFHKLWAFSYPDKELKDVYYQREEGNIKLRRVRPQQRSR